MTLAERYGQFLSGMTWDDLPGHVREKILDLVADWMANAAAGLGSEIGQALSAVAQEPVGNIYSVLLGSLEKAAPLNAALINGGACHALEFDDAYRKGLYHPGAPVISSAWAAAGILPVPGCRFLSAVAAGYEVSMRIAEAVNPDHNRRWHTTGTVGSLGAAAAASHCLGLDAKQSTSALGLAGTQAAGLWEILPDAPAAKGLHAGRAAQSGLMAALLAKQNIPGPSTILEGPRGMFNAMVSAPLDSSACLEGLGQMWRLSETTIKAYPVCGHTMTSIEAALVLAQHVEPDDIRTIEIRAHSVSADVAGIPAPRTVAEAKFSIAFCTALALARKRVILQHFVPSLLTDPAILSLLSKTRLVVDDALTSTPGLRPAKVTLWLQDGAVRSETACTRKGDPENPLTRDEVKTKFMDLTGPVWKRDGAAAVFEAIGCLIESKNFYSWLDSYLLPWQKKTVFHNPSPGFP